MHGRLAEFSVADLLQLYQISVKTGTLRVCARGRAHTLYIDRGYVSGVGAEHWHLVSELRQVEWLPPDVRQQLNLMERDGGFVGLSLIARALLAPDRWDQFVERQIEQLVYPLFSWQDGEFRAEVDVIPKVAPLRVNQAPQQLILNAARWEEELRQAAHEGYGRDSAWVPVRDLPEGDDPLLEVLSGPRTVDELSAAAGMSVIQVIERLRSLHADGVVARADGAVLCQRAAG